MVNTLLIVFSLLYLILPEYFALEISGSLPLLTAQRVLILSLFASVLKRREGKIRIRSVSNLHLFFAFMVLLNFVHIKDAPADVIKSLFSLVFEEVFLILLLTNLVKTRGDIIRMLRWVVYGSMFVSTMAIIEALSGQNPFYILTTVSRQMLQTTYFRSGIRRAEGPFGHPVYLAVYNTCMIPFCSFFYDFTKKKKYLAAIVLNIISCILTVTRGTMLIMMFMLVLIYSSKSKRTRNLYKRIMVYLLPLLLLSFAIPQVRNFASETLNSVLASFGLRIGDTAERNILGLSSRIGQLSGVIYLYNHGGILFGFGPNAQIRGMSYYLNTISGLWNQVTSFDVGYIGNIIEYGTIGLLAYIFLYYQLVKMSAMDKKNPLWQAFHYFYISYLFCLLSTTGIHSMFWFVTALMIAYSVVSKRGVMDMNQIRIGIFGAALSSVNFGVTALGISQIAMLEDIAKSMKVSPEYWIFSDEIPAKVEKLKEIIPVNRIHARNVIRIRTGISGLKKLQRDIRACDMIIDLTYGDSFSDIYGKKNFYLYFVPKLLAMEAGVPLVIGPQTIGPFKSRMAENETRKLLEKVKWIFVRDKESQIYTEKLLLSTERIYLTSDLAMELPYNSQKYWIYKDGNLHVGINVSLLLWESASDFGIHLDYHEYIRKLISTLLKRNYHVHLIAHVYDKQPFNEYSLVRLLHEEFPQTIAAPEFENPVDAKAYISNMDLFIGSRMHATIAALSSLTPVIPVAYSRKFTGLFQTLDYDHVVNLNRVDLIDAMNDTISAIDHLDELRKDVVAANRNAHELNGVYRKYLAELIRRYEKGGTR